jgi:hypothetical protein
MQILLMFVVVVLTIVICALAGFWFFRPDPVYRRKARSPKAAPRAINQVAKQVAWTITGRPFRDRA